MVRLALVVLLAAACDRGGDGAPAKGSALPDHPGEQAEFDRERRPDVVIATIGLQPGDVVADVGAGTGLLTIHIARAVSPGGRVVATDVDATVLDLLDARMQEAGLTNVERRVVSPGDPALEGATFDVILLAQVDHYFDDAEAWLRTAVAALTPGGKIALTNRVHHRARGLAAAKAAGLRLIRETMGIPGQYVAVFSPEQP